MLGLLTAFSGPGINTFLLAASFFGFLGTATWWLGCAIGSFSDTYFDYPDQKRWRFSIAPVAGILAIVLVVSGVPLRVRWALSESSFATYAATAPAADSSDEWINLPPPGRLGLYWIDEAEQAGEAIIFYPQTGAKDGFAYLPNGPSAELYERWYPAPSFRHLGGPWYTFTSGW